MALPSVAGLWSTVTDTSQVLKAPKEELGQKSKGSISGITILGGMRYLINQLEYSVMTSVHCNLRLPGSSDSHTSASLVVGITGICHNAQLIFCVFLVEMKFHYVGQVDLEHLASSDPTA
ncbi:Zinc finger protein [Plecturocebus cupreus]